MLVDRGEKGTHVAGSVDLGAGSLREEDSEEGGGLELVTRLAAGERTRSSGARSDTVGVGALVADRSTARKAKIGVGGNKRRNSEIKSKLTSC